MKNKQIKIYPKYFTVGQLKELLENVPPELPIGVKGHFGEFIEAGQPNYDYFKVGEAYLVPKAIDGCWTGWGDHDNEKTKVFLIPRIDIGPDPD
jgi:hypothetical protein